MSHTDGPMSHVGSATESVLQQEMWDAQGCLSSSSQPCLVFLSGMHDTKYKNLTLADVIEDDEWKSGYRPVPQTVVD
jgi:hypothetical protein